MTYQQQVRYWSKKGKDLCPKEQFLIDLAEEQDTATARRRGPYNTSN